MVWKITFTTLGDCYYFNTHARNCVMEATPMSVEVWLTFPKKPTKAVSPPYSVSYYFLV